MISKARGRSPGDTPAGKGRRSTRSQPPLEVRLSMKVNFGAEPGESVTLMSDRRIPMVSSVFENRDRILRSFALLLVRASMAQPKVVREVFPALRLVGRLRGKS